LGRFHTLDPKAESFQFQSPFAYAANNPILFIDKNGENPAIPAAAAVAVNAALIGASLYLTYYVVDRTIDYARDNFGKTSVRSSTKSRSYSLAHKTNKTKKQKNSNHNRGTKGAIAFGTSVLAFEAYINMKSTIDENWSTPMSLPSDSEEQSSDSDSSDNSDDSSSNEEKSTNSNGTDSDSKDNNNEDSEDDLIDINSQIQPSDNTQPSTYGY
jgi:hypothetical protein